MAYNIPTLQELYSAHLARLESQLGQSAPTNDKAFLRVLALSEAAQDIGLYKYAADRAKQNLALIATGSDLDNIGNNNSTPRKPATTSEVTATLTATTGTVIPSTIDFIADANGLLYRPTAPVTAVANVATLTLQCRESGVSGQLEIGDTLEIASQISGANTTATVTAIVVIGLDAESDADYRPRVLFAQRAITGGANATDHKIWSEAVTGVKRGFWYSGRPADEGTSYPGDRQGYIEATTDISPDGIAPAWLLALVRTAINTDPDTGLSRTPLGLTDSTLFLRSISRTTMHTEVRDLVVDSDKEAACKADITTALTLYYDSVVPFVDGVDLPQERSDTITSMSVGQVVQDVLQAYGATASSVGFGIAVGVFLTQYVLGTGELCKIGTVTYA
jgi:hypothetical protein